MVLEDFALWKCYTELGFQSAAGQLCERREPGKARGKKILVNIFKIYVCVWGGNVQVSGAPGFAGLSPQLRL